MTVGELAEIIADYLRDRDDVAGAIAYGELTAHGTSRIDVVTQGDAGYVVTIGAASVVLPDESESEPAPEA